MKIHARAAGAVAVLLSTGILLAGDQKPSQSKQAPGNKAAVAQSVVAAGESGDYVIGPQDVLTINVWKEPEISLASAPVRPDGKISLVLLNDVQAAGLTPAQLTAAITEKLRQFIAEPRVTVMVKEMNSQRFYVMGEVTRPGAFPLTANLRILQGISSGGGFTQNASTRKIYVLRMQDQKQVKLPFDYQDVVKGVRPDQNVVLKPGDTIVVP